MNLENFPTSPTGARMVKMVSNGFYDESYVGKWIYQVIGLMLDAVGKYVDDLPDQAFLDRATWGLRYWELLVGLPVGTEPGEDDDADAIYEERREKIRNKLNNRHSVNPEWLSRYLTSVTGRECTVIENPRTYTFTVKIQNGDHVLDLLNMFRKLDEVKPAHLAYNVLLIWQYEIGLQVGMALHLTNHKRAVTEIEDPMLKMQTLSVHKQTITPPPSDLVELIGEEGRGYFTDGTHFLSDGEGNLLYEEL